MIWPSSRKVISRLSHLPGFCEYVRSQLASEGFSLGTPARLSSTSDLPVPGSTIKKLFCLSVSQLFITSRTCSYLRRGRCTPTEPKYSSMTADLTSMRSLKVVAALLINSTGVVAGVTGNSIFDLPHSTSTLLSPAFTAEIGASVPGTTPPPPARMACGPLLDVGRAIGVCFCVGAGSRFRLNRPKQPPSPSAPSSSIHAGCSLVSFVA